MKQLMNDYQVERYDMVCALLVFFGLNPMIIAEISDLADLILLLTSDRNDIDSVATDRDEKKTEFKDAKPESRSNLGTYTFMYSRKLRALGKKANILELTNLSCPSQSEIDKMRFSNLSEYSTEILDFLKKYLLQLSGQKVAQADVDAFEAMVEAYKLKIASMDVTRDESIEDTGDLEEKFTAMMSKVFTIDDIIDGMRNDYKEFCDTYDVTRKVHEYGLRHKTAEELALLRAKDAARKVKARLARKENAEKAKADKLKKLQDELSHENEALAIDTKKLNGN